MATDDLATDDLATDDLEPDATDDEPSDDEPAVADPVPTGDEREAFPILGSRLVERLKRRGSIEETEAGQILFSEGDRDFDFFVVLEGTVEILEHSDGDENTVTVHRAGEFTGDVDMLTGRATLVTARVGEPGEVLRLPCHELRRVLSDDPEASDVLVRGFLHRRRLLLEAGFSGVKVIGPEDDRDTFRLRLLFDRNHVPHTWLEPDGDEARTLVRQLGVETDERPLVVYQNEHVLVKPSTAEMACRIGLDVPGEVGGVYDLVVVGAGPAGLAATVYAASEGLRVLLLDAFGPGGQAGASSKIENYLGFPAGLSGSELAGRAVVQALKFGAEILVPVEATALERDDGHYRIALRDGRGVEGRSVVLATGAHYRRLPLPRLRRLEGRGVYYAATHLEAQLCRGETVAIVGGGNSAGQAAMFLSRCAERVLLVVRGDGIEDSMSRYLVERLEGSDVVEIHRHSEVVELEGDGALEAIVLARRDGDETRRERVPCQALFTFVGAEPYTHWLPDDIARDPRGFLRTGDALEGGERTPRLLETSWPGVFAVGDVRSGSVKRVAAAVGEGSMAVKLVHEHLASIEASIED